MHERFHIHEKRYGKKWKHKNQLRLRLFAIHAFAIHVIKKRVKTTEEYKNKKKILYLIPSS